ncbi:MAG: hypothetical protein HC865_23025 [Cyanobacteria bacterium RU_5_0]|nr:hypothetical protein [Cyanobacteria bacterium RU_5_0]
MEEPQLKTSSEVELMETGRKNEERREKNEKRGTIESRSQCREKAHMRSGLVEERKKKNEKRGTIEYSCPLILPLLFFPSHSSLLVLLSSLFPSLLRLTLTFAADFKTSERFFNR